MKDWETEFFAMNLKVGTIQKVISEVLIEGINFEAAQLKLVELGYPHLRLTGQWYRRVDDRAPVAKEERIDEEEDETLIEATNTFNDDEFIDWIDDCSFEVAKELLSDMKRLKLEKHYRITLGHLKYKYNYGED